MKNQIKSLETLNERERVIITKMDTKPANSIVVFLEKSETNYSAYIPELEGCVAELESFQEAVNDLEEAAEFHLEGIKEGIRYS